MKANKAPRQELPRHGYSPTEFAALFGRSQVWGYRRIYAGDVKVIDYGGLKIIPVSQVERFTNVLKSK
jgi:hypothetical protein